MKKILVVLTGGTIGSTVEAGVINVNEKSPYLLLQKYEEIYKKNENFEVIQPLNILSENMTPNTLLILLKALERITYEDYAGVIITHGSDTLSYTSAFVGMLFYHVPVPIILIASNYPIGQEGSNGLSNFANAVELIRRKAVRGVFTLYQNHLLENQIYLSTRVVEADPFLDQFRDFSGTPFGKMEQEFILYGGKDQPSLEEVEGKKERQLSVPNSFSKNILLIRPYPGMDYSEINPGKNTAAVLHLLYHSATACTEGGNYSLLSFAEKCRKKGIDFYTASHKKIEGDRYATGDSLFKAGVRPLLNISPEAAYAKLLLLYNLHDHVTEEMTRQNIYFESIISKMT